MRSLSNSSLRYAGAILLAIVAGVHFQQYVDFMSEISTVGVLFLLNASGGAALAVALLRRDPVLNVLSALAGLGMAIASLGSIAIALSSSFFKYSEPTLRLPIVIAIVAEVLAVIALGGYLATSRRDAVK